MIKSITRVFTLTEKPKCLPELQYSSMLIASIMRKTGRNVLHADKLITALQTRFVVQGQGIELIQDLHDPLFGGQLLLQRNFYFPFYLNCNSYSRPNKTGCENYMFVFE